MIKWIKRCLINNDNEYINNQKFHTIFNKLLDFEYKQMTYAGEGIILPNEKGYILNFDKSSMFCYNDPIELIVMDIRRRKCIKSLNIVEKQLFESIENLIIKTDIGEKRIKYSQFSGVVNARDYDWETLKNYGHNSHIQINTEIEYEKYINEIKTLVKRAIYHTWTNRYYFCNNDGSHRLAAINNYAINHKKDTEILVNVDERKINKEYGKIIIENFIGIITTGETYGFLVNLLKDNKINSLLEISNPEKTRNYILWLENTQDKLLIEIIKFINLLHFDRCYIISNDLKKYI